ncbi:MAG: ChbG/HpnK family deacetylase [Hyphomicrobiaceae bacterium]
MDDFGQHEGINRAALDLAGRRRVSAVSCLVDGSAWHSGARVLQHASGVEVGLHLNFTEDFGQGACHALPGLIARAYARLLDSAQIRAAIERQFERFERAMGRLPEFVDGHQHVHQLPVIRDQLIAVMNQRYGSASKPWLRSTLPAAACRNAGLPPSTVRKAQLIGWLGASSLRGLARRQGYSQNRHLVGVYGFELSEAGYLQKMKAWLDCASDGDVLMCHPSLPWRGEDPLQAARNQEYRALSSEAFSALLESAGLEIGPRRSPEASR